MLRGRDIQRYQAEWAELWLISTFPALQLDIDDYPAVKKHLLSFGRARLEQSGKKLSGGTKARKKTGNKWFETQDQIAYHADFAKEKIVWGNLNDCAKFSYAPKGMFVNAPSTILTPFNHYLLAALNSKLLDWYFRLIGAERDGGYYEYKPMFIERLPLPQISLAKQRPFVRLVDRILEAKDADPQADTDEMEAEIDRLVCGLYGLTAEEVAVVEGRR